MVAGGQGVRAICLGEAVPVLSCGPWGWEQTWSVDGNMPNHLLVHSTRLLNTYWVSTAMEGFGMEKRLGQSHPLRVHTLG